MSLDVSPTNLFAEVRGAELFASKRLKVPFELQDRYAGPNFRQDSLGQTDLENHSHEFISLIGPLIIFDNPQVRWMPRDIFDFQVNESLNNFAREGQFAHNRWIRDVDLRSTLLAGFTDFAFAWSVTLTVSEPINGYDPSDPDTPYLPRVYRVPPHRFFVDPRVADYRFSRFMGHFWYRDKGQWLEEARAFPERGWITKAIAGLVEQEFQTAKSSGAGNAAFGFDVERAG